MARPLGPEQVLRNAPKAGLGSDPLRIRAQGLRQDFGNNSQSKSLAGVSFIVQPWRSENPLFNIAKAAAPAVFTLSVEDKVHSIPMCKFVAAKLIVTNFGSTRDTGQRLHLRRTQIMTIGASCERALACGPSTCSGWCFLDRKNRYALARPAREVRQVALGLPPAPTLAGLPEAVLVALNNTRLPPDKLQSSTAA